MRRWTTMRAAPIALAALLSTAATALAQVNPPANRPEERPLRETEDAAAAARAAAASRALPEAGPPVSYDQVLANPDDVGLNYRYAVQQIRAGDPRGASTTLERILLVNPNLLDVRLLYAIVLFRLDDLDEARREFTTLRARPDAGAARGEIDGYLAQIELRDKPTRYAATISLGMDYNTNRDAKPAGGTLLVGDLPTVTQGGRHDFGRLAIGSFEVHHDLGTQERDELFAIVSGYLNDQVHVKTQNLRAVTLETGAVIRRDIANFTPSFIYTYATLENHPFISAPGVKLLIDRQFTRGIAAFALFTMEYQDFYANPVAPIVAGETGWRYDAQFGLNFALTPDMKLTPAYRHGIKKSEFGPFAYDTDELGLAHTWLLGAGQFLLTSGTFGIDHYQTVDPNVSPTLLREDKIFRLRTTYGVPLGTIAGLFQESLPEPASDIVLSVMAELLDAKSTVPNYAFHNYKGQMLLTKRWEF